MTGASTRWRCTDRRRKALAGALAFALLTAGMTTSARAEGSGGDGALLVFVGIAGTALVLTAVARMASSR